MIVLLDNGHGENTPGKRSPDGTLREYAWARELALKIQEELIRIEIECILITPEEEDISLNTRTKRANQIISESGKDSKDFCLISIHNNAAGSDGNWHNASGWSVFVSENASDCSKKLATIFAETSENDFGLKTRKYSASELYWTQDLAICRDIKCPAVLTENMFMDNKSDYEYLMSEDGKNELADLHVAAIKKYVDWIGE